jgi:DinB family protein
VYPHIYGPLNLDAVDAVLCLARDDTGRFLVRKETAVNSLAPLLSRLDAGADAMADLRPAVIAGEPWPVGAAAGGDGEASWGPTEVLAHVAEMLTFWLGEMERVVAGGPNGPAHFGRTPDDQIRGMTVIRDSTLPARELFDRIEATRQRYDRRLPELTEDEIARVGLHPVRGRLTAQDIIEKLVVDHLEEHVTQVRETLPG